MSSLAYELTCDGGIVSLATKGPKGCSIAYMSTKAWGTLKRAIMDFRVSDDDEAGEPIKVDGELELAVEEEQGK